MFIRKVVRRESIKAVTVPKDYGDMVELIVLSIEKGTKLSESKEMMELQEQAGFVNAVLVDSAEDVWNDI
ncbi:hypothetical protein KAI46_02340 [bacterium]|nr:hypothetical protein [bacterium]